MTSYIDPRRAAQSHSDKHAIGGAELHTAPYEIAHSPARIMFDCAGTSGAIIFVGCMPHGHQPMKSTNQEDTDDDTDR
ncbi:MAG: hypothetical protein Fur005_15660 [Roseiflexaceae bacterium]